MALIQAVGSDVGHVSTGTVTIAATTAGSSLIVAVFGYTGGTTVTSVKAGSGTAIAVADFALATNGNGPIAVFSIPSANVATGTTSVTIIQSAAEWTCAMVIEESSLSATPFDKSAGQNLNGVTAWSSGNTATTTQASEIAYGFSGVGTGTSLALTPDAGWALLSGTGIDANGQVQETTAGLTMLGMRRVLSVTGAYAASGTGPNDTYGTVVATYKTGAAPAVPPQAMSSVTGSSLATRF